ncbi:PEPxxWA-CTERM sorting domain-containing protein [Phenylobacterium sp.]|uniref:PEPxxWA-CTERM sorting domain-containing protein n=1 Tax=Phenylobacterium sp. TaxID=1871053 RepID=UPI0025D57CA2|nr:PEPxxWA-CTERM sorting domain-containing protein [Phenylobacterium sp.]
MYSHKLAAFGAVVALLCIGSSAQAAAIDFSTLQVNGSATATPTALRLTDGSNLGDPMDPNSNIGEAGSAYISTAFNSYLTFTSSFTFSMTNTGFSPLADGLTFIIQNDPNGAMAVGGGGGGVGANGLASNIGIGFQSWDNNRVSFFRNGGITGGPIHNFNLGDQDDLVDVTVAYDGTNLSYSAFNHTTGLTLADSRTFHLRSLGPQVYFGFTGGTGLSYSIQDVTNWDLTVGPGTGAVPEPAAWALMLLGFAGMGGALRRSRRVIRAAT